MQVTYQNILPGFLLLLLAISGNFLAGTFGCHLKDKLESNALYKNILVFLLIYFTIYFAEHIPENPSISLLKTIGVYLFYLLFVKQLPETLLLALFFLVAAFVCDQWIDYTNAQATGADMDKPYYDYSSSNKTVVNLQITLVSLCFAVTLIGFAIAYSQMKHTAGVKVSFMNYFFRNFECSRNASGVYEIDHPLVGPKTMTAGL